MTKLLNNPEYVKIDEKIYRINTDFRVAIKCNEVSMDKTIGDNERGLAIIYLLFGDEGLNDKHNYVKLLELGKTFLLCNQELDESQNDKERDFDFVKDKGYIQSSFKYDYKYDPYALDYLHWWDFYNDLLNLSNSEFGNCCILNRIRNLRNFDVSKIKDAKEKAEMEKAKEAVSLNPKRKKEYTQEELNNINNFYEQIEARKE